MAGGSEEQTLAGWVIGVVSAAIVAGFGWMANHIFAGFGKKLSSIDTKLEKSLENDIAFDKRLGELTFGQGQTVQKIDSVESRMDELAKFWRARYERQRETVTVLKEEIKITYQAQRDLEDKFEQMRAELTELRTRLA